MTPEQLESAEQVVAYGLDKLRALELQHAANPPAIFGELLAQLVAAELKAQRAAALAEQNQTRLFELIGAAWEGNAPPGVDHALTLARIAALCEVHRAAEAHADPDGNDEIEHFVGGDNGAETERPAGP